jgi:hypothetical protein
MAPNYSLEKIKELAAAGGSCIQLSKRAKTEAFNEFGFSVADICEEIQLLRPTDFYKSATSKLNGLPLDAYRKKVLSKVTKKHYLTYIKFQIIQQLIVVSFHTSDY